MIEAGRQDQTGSCTAFMAELLNSDWAAYRIVKTDRPRYSEPEKSAVAQLKQFDVLFYR